MSTDPFDLFLENLRSFQLILSQYTFLSALPAAILSKKWISKKLKAGKFGYFASFEHFVLPAVVMACVAYLRRVGILDPFSTELTEFEIIFLVILSFFLIVIALVTLPFSLLFVAFYFMAIPILEMLLWIAIGNFLGHIAGFVSWWISQLRTKAVASNMHHPPARHDDHIHMQVEK